MEDLSEVLKKTYLGLYKQKHEVHSVKDRVVKMNEQRKQNRHEEMFEKRRIPQNMSPCVTPAPKRERTPTKPKQNVNKRLEMLAKWKEEKQKRKEVQKKTLKPVFKVSHVPVDVGLPKLDNVNLEIKGKPFKSKFAPPNHKFKPPANIKPIHFNVSTVSVKSSITDAQHNSTTAQNKKGKTDAPLYRMTTRSQTRANSTCSVDSAKSREKVKKTVSSKKKDDYKNANETTNDQSAFEVVINNNHKEEKKSEDLDVQKVETSIMSPDYPLQTLASSSESDDPKTPKKVDPPVYISPFVTVSRGKNSARKEYEARKSGKSFDSCASPKAGAAYFTWLLDTQISRLQGLCDQWNRYKEDEELPEEAVSMIDVSIGQTNLLVTKKFEQFRGLIEKCRAGDKETPVSLEDLHGFWDMMHLQVDNLDKRFENLDNLKTNNWQEILPVIKKEVAKKKGKAVRNAKASAGLREAILAARRKKQGQNLEEQTFSGKKTPQNRRSSNRLVVVRTEEKKRNSSPGLMMMKVAQYAKTVETPAKSILKTDCLKSAKSQSKSVLFKDEINISIEDAENDLNKTNIASTKSKTPTRRSMRLIKNKLF